MDIWTCLYWVYIPSGFTSTPQWCEAVSLEEIDVPGLGGFGTGSLSTARPQDIYVHMYPGMDGEMGQRRSSENDPSRSSSATWPLPRVVVSYHMALHFQGFACPNTHHLSEVRPSNEF
jgi:hypothetical protein